MVSPSTRRHVVGHVMFGLCEAKQMFVFKKHAFFLSTLISTDQHYTGYKYFNNTNYAKYCYCCLRLVDLEHGFGKQH